MAVTYNATLKSTRMAAVITAIDAHASPAKIVIMTGASAVLATLPLSDPSFTESAGVITLDNTPTPSGVATGTGTAALASIRTGGDVDVITGLTVAAPSGGDINLNSTSITTGQTVTLTAGTITHG